MKHLVFSLTQKKKYAKALKQAAKKKYRGILLQVFTSEFNEKKLLSILRRLQDDFPTASIVGVTAAGEIAGAKMLEHATVVSLSLFEKTQVDIAYTSQIDEQSGLELAKKICREKTKAVILLSEGLKGKDYEGFLKGFKKHDPSLVIVGGLAGDELKLEKTFVLYQTNIYEDGSVAVALSGEDIYASNRYNLNRFSVGQEFVVTKANGNVVEEIDSQNIIELCKTYLGEDIFDLSQGMPDFQLLYKAGDTVISRTPLRVEENKVIFAAPVKEGQRVRFGFSNAASVISGAHKIAKEIAKKPADAIYIFSCIARKFYLHEMLENEFKAFEKIAPTAGFFTYGEYFGTSKNIALLNCTTTILVLSENIKRKTKKTKHLENELFSKTKDSLTFKVLTNFIERTTTELDSNIHLLQQYKEIIDKAFLAVKIDTQGNITYVNENFCRLGRCDRKNIQNQKNFYSIDQKMIETISKKLKNEKLWHSEVLEIMIDAERFYIDTVVMPIMDETLQIIEYLAIGQDITKQVKAQKELEEKNRFIEAIFDHQESIVVTVSKKKKNFMMNKKFFEYFDFASPEDFCSKHKSVSELFVCEKGYINEIDNPDWIDLIEQNPNTDYKVKMVVKDGKTKIFKIKVNLIENRYIISLNDITSLEHAIKKAHSSERAKAAFLASMSHEIRTPLNGIIGFTKLLKKELKEEKTKHYVEIIDKSSQMLLHIVNDILDFSKIESGEITLVKESADFKEEIKSVALTFSSLSKEKQLSYAINIDPDIPDILVCDIQRIKQVVANLLGNAVKFTPEHGLIKLEVKLEKLRGNDAEILISVIDNGIGISKEKQKTIFQPFAQADGSIDRKYGGTGLGLSISSKFVELMGSQIKLESKEGVGSRFFFRLNLPVAKTNEKSKSPEQKSFEPYRFHKVLIVEDNETNRLLLELFLQERKIEFDSAIHGKQAINKIAKISYDLVLMDINMPVMDGLSAIKELRKRGYTMPIVTLSANVIESDIQEFIAAGASDTLHKPIVAEKLDAILKKYLYDIKSKTQKKQNSSKYEFHKRLQDRFALLDNEAIEQLAYSFQNSISELLEKLQNGIFDYKTAHTIKGLAANFGFDDIAEIAAKAEKCAMKGEDEKELESLREQLKKKLEDISAQLTKENEDV